MTTVRGEQRCQQAVAAVRMRWLVHAVLLVGGVVRILHADCPRLCECKWKSGKESVVCLSANLSAVPTHLDAGTQVLDLTANQLVALRHDEFGAAGLLNLQKVYVAKCRLRAVERYAFRRLSNLVELDLSYNALAAVPSHALDSIPELRELRLSGNPIQRVGADAFAHVPQLVRLELAECRLAMIDAHAFRGGVGRSLEWLRLDGNRLAAVAGEALAALESLHGLELAGNPWNCSCALRPLREWLLRRNVPCGVPPACDAPNRLRARLWDKLDLDEFACAPGIRTTHAGGVAHAVEGRNVTMACRITGVPPPNVRWLLRNKVIANLSHAGAGNRKLYLVRLANTSSDLTILAADAADAGVYVCAAENKAGKVEASVTLAITRRPASDAAAAASGPLGGRALLASIVVGVLFVLAGCLASLCALTLRRKRCGSRRWHQHHHEDEDKIEMGRKPIATEGVNGRATVGELALVARRQNGDYRVVPAADTDHEVDDDDDDPNHHAAAAARKQRETSFWRPPLHDTKIDTQWDALDRLIDHQDDLHIPRRTTKLNSSETRGDLMKEPASTCGTFSSYQQPSTSAIVGRVQRGKTKEPLSTTTTTTTTSSATFSSELTSLFESDERKYPDLLSGSPNASNYHTSTTTSSSTTTTTAATTRRASSEGGGSVADISELFCTLPRRRSVRYASVDSESPLLADSRYGSSGGESSSSSQHHHHHLHHHLHPHLQQQQEQQQVNNRSSSYLNLTRADCTPTPLLDVAGLEARVRAPPPAAPAATAYDYHAAQLERFLEEYRTLQKELTRMKETCDSMRAEKQMPTATATNTTTPNANHEHLARYLLKSSPKAINSSGLFDT